ncbi:MAG TPA: LacI family DNA-binding transcriptional regulator, partial [Caballeronia sp.]|nr:LacI family DNA-binding transcriptional regulator [Caballeronia sp.]
MKKSTQRRPTMTDIAKLTGVSQSTVSLVLNNATSAKFSDATRNKVLKAAQDLGYRMTAREPLDTAIAATEKN